MAKVDVPAPGNKENIVRSGLNYSPNMHLRPCIEEQRRENKTCNESSECLEDDWETGCASSWALNPEIGAHYLVLINYKDVSKNRCFFLVIRHPDGKQYFSGVIFIQKVCEDTDPDFTGKGWVVGEPIPFEPQTVEWDGHYRGEKWMSNREALEILEKYYYEVKDEKVEQVIDFYKTGNLPDFAKESRPCPPEVGDDTYVDEDSENDEDHGDKSVTNLLLTKKQIILYGPPGTGKTYKARELAVELIESEVL